MMLQQGFCAGSKERALDCAYTVAILQLQWDCFKLNYSEMIVTFRQIEEMYVELS